MKLFKHMADSSKKIQGIVIATGCMAVLLPLVALKPAIAATHPQKAIIQSSLDSLNLLAFNDVYKGSEGDFEIWMPEAIISRKYGELSSRSATTSTVYFLFHNDVPDGADIFSNKGMRLVMEAALRQNFEAGDRVVKSTDMVVDSYPGLDFLVQHADGSKGQYQTYLVKRRLYILAARTPNELTTETTSFFESFRVYPDRLP